MQSANENPPQPTAADLDRDPRSVFNEIAGRCRDQLNVQRFGMLGRGVHLHTVGGRLHGHLTAALAHLRTPPAAREAGDLSVFLWDEDTTGVPHPHAVLSGRPDDEELIDVSHDNLVVRERRGQWAVALDRGRGEISGCARLGGARPLLHDLGKPLQTLISIWARDSGMPLVHAGLVGRDGNGILLGGAGGAGKSTTAVACAREGFDFLGDDRVGLEAGGDGFVGHSIYNSVLVDQPRVDRFPELCAHAIQPVHPTRERKPLVFLNEIYPGRIPPSVQIRGVALPRVAGTTDSRWRTATPAEALRVIAPSSLIMPMGPGAVGMKQLGSLVREVPCFWLDLGTALEGVAACVEQVLEEACA